MNEIMNNWIEIKETVRREYNLTTISYSTWIEPLQIQGVIGDTVIIVIPSDQTHILNYISNKYKSFFQVTISEMFNHMYDVNFILESDIKNQEIAEQETNISMPIYNQNYENANLNP